MKISGFSFAKNTVKLYYPFEEAIRSILPICDEFIIAIGKGDEDDTTREIVEGIGDSKIRIIDTVWRNVLKNQVLAQQTNIALEKCTGDWCFYIQGDEVVHEDDLPVIKKRCEELFPNNKVEGLIFDFLHFWGDYDHYHTGHGWYKREIRIVRNMCGIKSRNDAQSFRLNDERKLQVAHTNARVFHYGYVRPPHFMQTKSKSMDTTYHGKDAAEAMYKEVPVEFDYGPLNRLAEYKGTHPAVMKDRIADMNWKDKLRDVDPPGFVRKLQKDERPKYRLISSVERLTGLDFNHRNWRRLLNV